MMLDEYLTALRMPQSEGYIVALGTLNFDGLFGIPCFLPDRSAFLHRSRSKFKTFKR
jgi:hypothetical protein